MAAQIRQEINITDAILTSTGGTRAISKEVVQMDTTQYNGTVTYYFEVLARATNTTNALAELLNSGGTAQTSVSITTADSTYRLYRSASFTPSAATQDYETAIGSTVGSTVDVKASRIIVIQNATTLTNTETQIEIGNASATTTTTDTALTNPKYWQYTGANWNGTITAYFESTFLTGTSKSAATMTLQTSSDPITAPTWSNVASSAVTTTSTTAVRVRSAAITLVAGNWYRAVMKAGNSKSGITTYNAKVIVDQSDTQLIGDDSVGNNMGAVAGNTKLAQSFKFQTSAIISAVKLRLKNIGSPVDNFTVNITSSLGGSSLANATLAGGSITASFVEYTFTLSATVSCTGGTIYYIEDSRSGSNDNVNYYSISGFGGDVYNQGSKWVYDGISWSDSGVDMAFKFTIDSGGGFTKLEPQYLLANTLFAAGTALQLFLTNWDSTEWDAGAGTITYTGQAEAANGSTSDVLIQEADAGSTLVTLTNIDNALAGAATMPTSQNLDVLANANAGDVAAARILVAYVYSAAAAVFIAQLPYFVKQAIKRASTY